MQLTDVHGPRSLTAEKALVLAGIKFAQSEYAVACAILNKCLDTEFGQSNGFKPPTIDATVAAADVAELAASNPWNKFGASSGEAAAVQSAMTPAVPAKSALIQPTKAPMDDINHAVLGAMVRTVSLFCAESHTAV
jgi:hypothetical protein